MLTFDRIWGQALRERDDLLRDAGGVPGETAGDSGDAGAAGAATSPTAARTPSAKTAPSISVETPAPTRGSSRGGSAANAVENDPTGVEASPRTPPSSDPEKRNRQGRDDSANNQYHQGKGEGKGDGARLSEDGKGSQVEAGEKGGGEGSGDAEGRRREGERREKEVSLLRNLVDKLQREVEGLKSDHEVRLVLVVFSPKLSVGTQSKG